MHQNRFFATASFTQVCSPVSSSSSELFWPANIAVLEAEVDAVLFDVALGVLRLGGGDLGGPFPLATDPFPGHACSDHWGLVRYYIGFAKYEKGL
jgi:hypothetical protein